MLPVCHRSVITYNSCQLIHRISFSFSVFEPSSLRYFSCHARAFEVLASGRLCESDGVSSVAVQRAGARENEGMTAEIGSEILDASQNPKCLKVGRWESLVGETLRDLCKTKTVACHFWQGKHGAMCNTHLTCYRKDDTLFNTLWYVVAAIMIGMLSVDFCTCCTCVAVQEWGLPGPGLTLGGSVGQLLVKKCMEQGFFSFFWA